MVIGPFHIPKPDLTTVRERLNTVPQLEALVGVLGPPTGLRADPLTPQLREFFGVKTNEGVLVSSVDANSPASKAGLMAGDVIIAVDGTTISTPQEFNREVRSRNAAFTLKVVRNKQEREIRVERQREFGPGTQF
jgi:S1-C subfamily serine protease